MTNQLLLNLVNKALNQVGKPTSRGNYSYVCPFHISNPPGKKNLEVNFTENKEGFHQWHCWGCGAKGKKIHNLFRRANIPQSVTDDLKTCVSNFNPEAYIPVSYEKIALPKEYKPLYNISSKDIIAKHVLKYLRSRGLTKNDILKYNIGFCEEGEYRGHVIIPSFDSTFKLNYFIARTYAEDSFINYKNPPITKDVIGLESFVNFNAPITICEGIFDAIAIKRNVIPLFGKEMSNELKKKLALSKVDKIYIALDKDAMKQAIRHAKDLLDSGREVYLVELDDKDPSLMGFEHFTKLIQKVEPLTLSSFIEFKLKYKV